MGVWKKIGGGAKVAGKIVARQALGDMALFRGAAESPVVEGWRTSALGAAFVLGGVALIGWAPGQEQLGWALIASGVAALLGADAGVVGRVLTSAAKAKPEDSRK